MIILIKLLTSILSHTYKYNYTANGKHLINVNKSFKKFYDIVMKKSMYKSLILTPEIREKVS